MPRQPPTLVPEPPRLLTRESRVRVCGVEGEPLSRSTPRRGSRADAKRASRRAGRASRAPIEVAQRALTDAGFLSDSRSVRLRAARRSERPGGWLMFRDGVALPVETHPANDTKRHPWAVETLILFVGLLALLPALTSVTHASRSSPWGCSVCFTHRRGSSSARVLRRDSGCSRDDARSSPGRPTSVPVLSGWRKPPYVRR